MARILCAVVVVLSLVFCSTSSAALPGYFGVVLDGNLPNDAVSQPVEFAKMRAGGLSYVRSDASWDSIEPSPGVFNWTSMDTLVSNLTQAGLRWYPMLGYSVPWSTIDGDPFTPPDPNAYASYVQAVAARYGTLVDVYEIWNEPNNPTFWHGPDATPVTFMQLYLGAEEAVHSVDPTARVVVGGVLDSGLDGVAWLNSALNSVSSVDRAKIDAIGWHPYKYDPAAIFTSCQRASSMLAGQGLSVPIEISEVGWFLPQSIDKQTGKKSSRLTPAQFRNKQITDSTVGIKSACPASTRWMPYVWGDYQPWGLRQVPDTGGTQAYFTGIAFSGIKASNKIRFRLKRKLKKGIL